MKSLAFDISSANTGWSFIDQTKGIIANFQFGNIQPAVAMDSFQKLYFFANEIHKVIEEWQPDCMAFEEVIQVYGHGFKTARTLARLSGAAILQAYTYKKQEVVLFEPPSWRKALGLKGNCHKTQVQLEVIRRLKLLSGAKLDVYQDKIETRLNGKDAFKEECKLNEKELSKTIKAKYTKDEKKENKKEIEKEVKQELATLKKANKASIKLYDKETEKILKDIGVDLYIDTGLNQDVADSFGVNFALLERI